MKQRTAILSSIAVFLHRTVIAIKLMAAIFSDRSARLALQ
jgi:hypothetical protein